ncbi:MAG: choice-of-anchor L domain-containing protein [Flavobacteriales bacterium]
MKRIFTILFIVLGIGVSPTFGQLQVNSEQAALLVQQLMNCSKIKTSNVTFNGHPSMIGEFNSVKSNTGLRDGVILSTGDVKHAIGPNTDSGPGGKSLTSTTDNDLQRLAGNNTVAEAAVLEFDFIPITDSVSIRYVFASDEYIEYANSNFNDVFGFFLSGPGISGPYSNGAVNIALVPGSNTTVSVNSINNTKSSNLYIDNGTGSSNSSQYSNSQVIQYDGMTRVLVATHKVTPGQKYHIKLAIADVSDGKYDSAVFLQNGSFFSDDYTKNVIVTYPELYEGCDSAIVRIQMTPSKYNIGSIPLSFFGSAANGVDVAQIPNPLPVDPVTGKASFKIVPLMDNFNDDKETLNVVMKKSECSEDTIRLIIRQYKPITVTDYDTITCGGPVTISAKYSGGGAAATLIWDLDGSNNRQLAVNTGWNSTSYAYDIEDHCLSRPLKGQVNVIVNNKKPDAGPDQRYCSGTIASIGGSTTPGYTYQWTPTTLLSSSNTLNSTATIQNVSNSKSVNSYVVESDNGMCKAKDTVVLTVIPVPQAIIDLTPYLECPVFKSAINESSVVADSVSYTWFTSTGEVKTGKDALLTFANPGNYDVSLEVKNYNLCPSKDDALGLVQIKTKPTANFDLDKYDVNMIYPTVSVMSSPVGADTCFMRVYSEKGALVHEPTLCDFTYDIPTPGNNKFIQYVTAPNGCKDTLEKIVYVKPEYFVWAPNAFTINGDGLNEEFVVNYSWAIEDFELYVFDRWGQEIFHGVGDGRQVAWDGKGKNREYQPIGVYVYMYTYTRPIRGEMKENVKELGTITIIR